MIRISHGLLEDPLPVTQLCSMYIVHNQQTLSRGTHKVEWMCGRDWVLQAPFQAIACWTFPQVSSRFACSLLPAAACLPAFGLVPSLLLPGDRVFLAHHAERGNASVREEHQGRAARPWQLS